ncbi:LacI family DNA-binding transcriptional regulator [Phyllobacterium salinisoli]|uniref:LacI family DNA-binding transcriptional regulator n=1 Tax=Phyllobacterium salinisoli TaxID=1899321 RepID=A0A368K551_9HYPH|nr:substrate-binding domain-containing protein [Phyllobacterium salinisoli]RCS24509.1 LacI family DNA-binding transcriptional regulator [Phyllobacterium salinisoli]
MTTLQQVASRAGCSLATASRVLNGTGPVSDEMVRKVRRAAAEVGYRSTAGTSGSSRRRPVVGVLIPSITNPVFAASLNGIQNRMLIAGHGVLIAQSEYDPAREVDAVASLLNQQPTGLILTVCDAQNSKVLSADLPPWVLLGNPATPGAPAVICADNRQAGRDITEHLLACGHRRILFVSGYFKASDRARLRYDGYRDAMKAAHVAALEAVQIPFVDELETLDLSATLSHFAPSAIIASNDLLALCVIAAVRRHGLSVPDHISVAGFDGIAIGRLTEPVLTTVELPDATMGAAAASLLLDMAENGAMPRQLQVAHRLRRGGTVRDIT